ncbi:MAG: hypothetical protein K1X68_12930 [Saprospiraceae bacterium]|nr:hypothetical protein [Saprospiraceae bacterium]HMW40549.1 hypothetical protein [Saprospiraceae bacterium]HMX87767.1 hypothetical protein [Saprospiraceae bacterium]HMZ39343.1 hypothetical protein [Saprospiraceae bacterium]HNB30643.1 hypothetical protein [Saprospiraceae bacterium]
MRNISKSCCVFFLFTWTLYSQPVKIWSKLFGGNNTELANGGVVVNDSLIAFVGSSNSTNIANKGLTDMIIAVVNKNGNLKNFKTFGSPQADLLSATELLPNGNLVCVGQVNGSGGDITSNYGLIDGYMLAYNPITNAKVWAKNFGGTNNDIINDVKYLEPGKVIFAGYTKSGDKDIPVNMGGTDAVVGSMDENGTFNAIKMFAGSKEDFAKKIAIIDGGSFYVSGETTSSNESAFIGLSNKGKKDVFVFKLNRNVNKLLAYMFGGPGDDILIESIATPDKGVIHVVNVNTAGGDIDSLIGGKDIFVVKYNEFGNLVWKRMIGGTKDDEAVAAKLNADGDLLITATSSSSDKDVSGNYGDKDVVLFKLSADGSRLQSSNYGGSRGDAAGTIILDKANTYLVSSSFSLNNDLPNTNTMADFWVLHLFECSTAGVQYSPSICIGDTVMVGGQKFYAGNTTGTVVLPKAGLFGCDSIIHVEVLLNTATSEILRDTLCNEESITINNVIFDRNNKVHTFPLKNAAGCDSTLIVDIYFNDPIAVIDSMLHGDNGNGNGFIHLFFVGGKPPYKFKWSNGSATMDIDNLRAGTYTVTVTDDLSCVNSFSFNIKNAVLNRDVSGTDLRMYQNGEVVRLESDQTIETVTIFQSTGAFVAGHKVSAASWQEQFQTLADGIYYLTVTLENGLNVSRKFSIMR